MQSSTNFENLRKKSNIMLGRPPVFTLYISACVYFRIPIASYLIRMQAQHSSFEIACHSRIYTFTVVWNIFLEWHACLKRFITYCLLNLNASMLDFVMLKIGNRKVLLISGNFFWADGVRKGKVSTIFLIKFEIKQKFSLQFHSH